MGLRRIVIDSDDDLDDFPSLRPASLASTSSPTNSPKSTQPAKLRTQGPVKTPKPSRLEAGPSTAAINTTVRRRKLGSINHDASLLRPRGASKHKAFGGKLDGSKPSEIDLPWNSSPEPIRPKPRMELRTRRTRRISELPGDDAGELSTEEATVLEDVALGEDSDESGKSNARVNLKTRAEHNVEHDGKHPSGRNTDVDSDEQGGGEEENSDQDEEEQHDDSQGETEKTDDGQPDADSNSEASEFQDSSVYSDSSSDSLGDFFSRSATKRLAATKEKMAKGQKKSIEPASHSQTTANTYTDDGSSLFFSAEESFSDVRPGLTSRPSLNQPSDNKVARKPPTASGLPATRSRPRTPPLGLPKKSQVERLQSPSKKLPSIPQTPHQPNTDDFWNQMIVDDWNMEHSPRKLLFDPDGVKKNRNPRGAANDTAPIVPALPPRKKATTEAAKAKDAKRLFQKAKHDMAEKFLAELDDTITDGKLSQLAAATGGVMIEWTNKLNTTAGRANWRRETLRPKKAIPIINIEDGSVTDAGTVDTTTRVHHHASIELAEKVIDDEHRLLNVIAHEFCHLANFMVSGITGNPHGKEFKAWAAQCSRHFGDRGIQVTTKHAYEIDFKYVWTCEACGTEFKRHSKSIDPARHRCGACKSVLKQTKPVPRGAGAKGVSKVGANGNTATTPGPSEYQRFMKEQMAIVRRENPNSPQKVIMTLVADKWTRAKAHKAASHSQLAANAPDNAGAQSVDGPEACVDRLGRALVDLTLG